MEIELTFDAMPLRRMLSKLVRDQVPFAIALALNDVAFEARREVVRKLPEHFTVRSTHPGKGMRVQKARKRTPVAVVGSVRPYMRSQALGSTERPQSSGTIAVPVGARPSPEAKTTRGKWPGAMLRKRGYYVAPTRSGVPGVWRRRGKRKPPELMWMFVKEVKIEPRWPLGEDVSVAVRKAWPKAAEAALRRAIATAKPRT